MPRPQALGQTMSRCETAGDATAVLKHPGSMEVLRAWETGAQPEGTAHPGVFSVLWSPGSHTSGGSGESD
jgi:hypothetical protein